MKLKFFFALGLTLIIACTNDAEKPDADSNSGDPYAFRSYRINMQAPKYKLDKLIEEVHIIGLEETDSSLLGNIVNVRQSDGFYYFSQEKALYIFNEQGKYVNSIHRAGEGPEEYDNILSHWTRGDTVSVYDLSNAEVLSYTRQGDFINSKVLPHQPMHMLSTDQGYWLNINDRLDSANYELAFIDESGENKQFYLPVSFSLGFPVYSNFNNFRWIDGAPTYKHFLKDTIYLLGEDNVRPFIHFDFGEKYLWNDQAMQKDADAAMQAVGKGGKVWVFNPYVGKDHIYMNYNTSFTDSEYILIDRQTEKVVRIDRGILEGEDLRFAANYWDSDRLLLTVGSSDLGELLKGLNPSQYTFETGNSLEEIESSENPVLVWVKFKMPEL